MEDEVKGNGYQPKRDTQTAHAESQLDSSLPQLFRNSRVEENSGRFPLYMRDEIAELLTKKMARIYKKRKNVRRTKTVKKNISYN